MKLTQNEIDAIVKEYQSGKSSPDIALRYSVSKRTVLRHLESRGIRRRDSRASKTTRNIDHRAFEKLNPASCYWIGFLCADGSISYRSKKSAQISISLQRSDAGHLKKLRDFLKSDHAISFSKDGRQCRFEINSLDLAEALKIYGASPGNNRAMKATGLRADRNFWRGVIDADGWFSFWLNGTPVVNLLGSESLLAQFKEFVLSLNIQTSAEIIHHKSACSFHLDGDSAIKLIQFLYEKPYVSLDSNQAFAEMFLGNIATI